VRRIPTTAPYAATIPIAKTVKTVKKRMNAPQKLLKFGLAFP